ncbi:MULTISPECIES: AAA family ATPase [unclassified Streptococcus]|uniref:AAA family ATPase n=1 Tax=unclassified Streptococcus TaxID=2608887 RepID=UPI00211AF222|nr:MULTISPECIES: AAA family ATPase [unclassified Streptococcus]MCQ9212786.1 AAA family ATPase [Streptococcus sp. B01]MCQ9214127.1 AAA family ATPase [Streptococcus sp. O1]
MSNLLDVTDQLYQQVRTLSLGQKMKMEFIAASITSPEILFLDEPTIGLDIQAKKDIREFLRKMNEEWQTTIILTSHDMDDISSVCDEVIVIDKGKILLQESMDIILSKFSDFKYLKIKMTLNSVPEVWPIKGMVLISQKDSEYLLKIPRDFVFEALEAISKLADIEDFELSNLSLEEIILQNYFTKKE